MAELTAEQSRRGAKVTVLHADGDPLPAEAGHCIRLTPAGRPWSWLPEQPGFGVRACAWTGRTGDGVDLVHAHGDYAAALAALKQARLHSCPAMLSVHGGLSERPWHVRLARSIFPRLNGVVAVSPAVRLQLVRRGVPAERIRVIPSGVRGMAGETGAETKAAAREELGLSRETAVIACVGRLHRVKGYDVLIKAMQAVWPGRPDTVVLFAGDGPERGALETQARGDRRMRFLGHQDLSGVQRVLRAADVFAHPARPLSGQTEGSPTAVLEALAMGLPVAASRTGGLPELIQSPGDGELTPPEHSEALAAALLRLLNPTERPPRTPAAERGILDWTAVAQRVTAFSEELIRQSVDGVSRR